MAFAHSISSQGNPQGRTNVHIRTGSSALDRRVGRTRERTRRLVSSACQVAALRPLNLLARLAGARVAPEAVRTLRSGGRLEIAYKLIGRADDEHLAQVLRKCQSFRLVQGY